MSRFPGGYRRRARTGRRGAWAISETASDRMAGEHYEKMDSAGGTKRGFPDWLRWTALVWLVLWFATYWRAWGPANFVHLCDIAVILTCIGLWSNSALLISSQAVSSLVVDTMWAVDVVSTIAFGRHVFGGTEYLFDAHYALWVRLLTLFHVAMPALLIWAVHRLGYDRRGWALQSGIAAAAFAAARFTSPAQNINFAFSTPIMRRQLGPAPVHVAISVAFMIFVVYWPTHWALKKLFAAPGGAAKS
jgi:hypothetical protein